METTTPTVFNNPEKQRYEVHVDGEYAGFAEYHLHEGVIDFYHTVVFEQFGGRGIAGTLARNALDDVRAKGERRVTATCPFFKGWIAKHPDYQDLLTTPA